MNDQKSNLIISSLIIIFTFIQSLLNGKYFFTSIILSIIFVSSCIFQFIKGKIKYQEYLTIFIIGSIFNFCLYRIIFRKDFYYIQIYLYLMSLCLYHFMEYTFVCVFHFALLKFDSKNILYKLNSF